MSLCIDIITLSPDMWQALDFGVVGRARQANIWQSHLWQLRNFSKRHDNRVDDRTYGGGPGMVLSVQPLHDCIYHIQQLRNQKPLIIQLDPAGQTFNAILAQRLSQESNILLLCGRYEGIDARISNTHVDLNISMGPYVLSAGDLPAMCLVDAVVRHLPGTLGNRASIEEDSYSQKILDTIHYSRPQSHLLGSVPSVLLRGNHTEIQSWRRQMALGRTWQLQPQLLENQRLTTLDIELLQSFMQDQVHDTHR